MKNKIYASLLLATLCITLALIPTGCSKDNLEDNLNCNDFGTLSYKSQIAPLLMSRCGTSGCHISGFASGDLTNHAGVLAKVNNGSMRKRTLDGSMPPNATISDDEIKMIVCWIDNGALNN
ncbi:MAG: hypothetical protein COB15_06795 [Flavobacteriales bacterium]|nr:MAG: hypothetical protein COB15_06795 [Flavobacteriales bacterium]